MTPEEKIKKDEERKAAKSAANKAAWAAMRAAQPKKPRNGPGIAKQKPWTREREELVCAAIREHGRLGDAARSAGVCRAGVERRRLSHPHFAQMVMEARKDFAETTIRKVQDFAWEGREEEVFKNGEPIGTKKTWFPQLQVLEARRVVPEYRDNAKVKVTGEIRTTGPDLSALSAEDLRKLREIMAKAKPKSGAPEPEDLPDEPDDGEAE